MARYDTVIRGGTVVDGMRLPRFRADVGIRAGRVAKIGRIPKGEGVFSNLKMSLKKLDIAAVEMWS